MNPRIAYMWELDQRRRVRDAFGILAGIGIVICVVVAIASSCGCARAAIPQTPRDTARAAAVLVSKAVLVTSDACAARALSTRDLPLAKKCEAAYDTARASLLSAESAIDAWDSVQAGNVACATNAGAVALLEMTHAMEAAGEPAPPVAVDAIAFVSKVDGCKR